MDSKKRSYNDMNKSNNNELVDDNNDDLDSNDSSDNENDKIDENEDEYDEIVDLPRKFYYFSVDKVNNITEDNISTYKKLNLIVKSYNIASKALEKASNIILENNSNLLKIFQKSLKRSYDDKKVAPGSNEVVRSIENDRFLLYLINILNVKIFYRLNQQNKIVITSLESSNIYKYLRNALLWFPRGIEGNYLYSCYIKSMAIKDSQLLLCENHLKKSIAVGNALKQEVNIKKIDFIDDELVNYEIKIIDYAMESLILLLIQLDRFNEALKLLLDKKYQLCLHRNILNYRYYQSNYNNISTTKSNVVKVFDNALPEEMLFHLQDTLQTNSDFWREHDYDDMNTNSSQLVGYFSYIYPMKSRNAICSIEQIIDYVYNIAFQHFPAVAEAQFAEWWTHNRSHSSGHQLHFDSDETAIESGYKPSHPIVSVVIYLSEFGGPTLVTDQTLQGHLAEKGWLSFPKVNRMTIFNANYLHGVIPGVGVTSASTNRRLSFMIGFWKDVKAKNRGADCPGPAQPFPLTYDTEYQWHKHMNLLNTKHTTSRNDFIEIDPIVVPEVWEPLLDKDTTITSTINISYDKCFQGF